MAKDRRLAPAGQGAGTFQAPATATARTLTAQRETAAPGAAGRDRTPPLTDDQIKAVVASYRDGASVRAIATDFGRAYGTIWRIVTNAGVMRSRTGK